MTDKTAGPPVNVTQRQLDECKTFVSGKLRNAVIECVYQYQPGVIANALNDLRALYQIQPIDAADTGTLKAPIAEDPQVAKKRQQAAQASHDNIERKRLGGRA
jgi:hypothetical protein